MNICILKFHQGGYFCLFHLLLNLQQLEQCLAQSQCSINAYRRHYYFTLWRKERLYLGGGGAGLETG